MKYPVNQRVRELMKALGYKGDKEDAHKFGQILLGKEARTEKVKNFYNDVNAVSADLLVLITTKLVNQNGEKPNGHWLLTGEGPMFLSEKHTPATNNVEADAKRMAELERLLEQALNNNEALIRTNSIHAESIRNFSASKVVEQG